ETSDGLRKAFIECAAIETFFLWHKYKKDKNGGDADTKLNSGTIPEEFKRQMFYTFGDFRDFLFGTDISKNHGKGSKLAKKIDSLFPPNNKKPGTLSRQEWWNENGPYIWKGMLCALEKAWGKDTIKNKSNYNYHNVKFSDKSTTLEKFAQTPQFLRWFTEWSDEFCRERKKKEEEVKSKCTSDYEGCKDTKGTTNCGKACKAYQDYIDKKKVEYTGQEGKFKDDKRNNKPGYNDISSKEAPEYLKENCLDDTCDCIEKVKSNLNYWEKPHTTYEETSLQKKCSCPPPPCEIVDAILGDKSSMGYVEGCRKKYMTTRSGMGWLCNDKEGEKGKEDGLCIPPRRQRLYVKDLEELKDENPSHESLREAFIKCAAVETFFAWHEYKQEEIKEEKEKNEQHVQYKSSVLENLQKQLKEGKIPEEFMRQMFYTFGDYRDIFFGKNIDSNMETVKKNINKVLKNGGSNSPSGTTTAQGWWKKYAPDIWEGMLCALSYNTETKEMDKELRNKLKTPSNNNSYKYTDVKYSDNTTTLSDFAKKPQFIRWLEEWAEDFCRKKKIKIDKIQKECRGLSGQNHCDGDGFDCDEMCPNKDERFETFKCLSCAKSCKSYKKWINEKNIEFEKQREKYKTQIKKLESNPDKLYDEIFVGGIPKKYKSIDLFLKTLKGPCTDNNTEECKIDFNKPKDTFGPAKNCAPCHLIRFKCIQGNSIDVTKNKCDKTTFKFTEDNKDTKEDSEQLGMLISDNTVQNFADGLENDCKNADIFKGVREDKWKCFYVCGVDICELITSDGQKDDKQNILIRALFKRWLEHFLEDYNQINDKISHCIKKSEGSTCIKGCKNKCNCVDKWIEKKKSEWGKVRDRYFKQYSDKNSEVLYEVKRFLEGGPFHSEVQKAIKPFTDLSEFEKSTQCNDTANSKGADGKKKDVVICLLDKLQNKIDKCKIQHKFTSDKKCTAIEPPNIDNNIPDTDVSSPHIYSPPFCNVPANPCSDKNDTNIVSVTQVAQEMQKEVKKGMLERSVNERSPKGKGSKGDSSKSSLEGDLSLAKFTNGTKPSGLNNEKICDLDKNKHSNAESRHGYTYNGPCTGKNPGRFKIGTTWKTKNQLEITDAHLFLPPRREHMCTSNLEHLLHRNHGPLLNVEPDKINHSFLGDVLLAAKYEAEFIKTNYTRLNGQNDNGAKCRAMKYSFADIGDIIRGKDLWEHKDFKNLERDLVKIFEKIKGELGEKYTDDESPYTKLREDWWEANREKVWEAMQCPPTPPTSYRGANMKCDDTTTTPLDDYIPQRLRWMMEWVEWYCKVQKEAYEELEKQCSTCKSGKCENGYEKCKKCTESCEKYKNKIKPWREQWEKIKEKYNDLYKRATESGGPIKSNDPKDQEAIEFLSKLQKKNTHNTIYSTAAGYIHQELPNVGCKEQTKFCTGGNNYAFMDPPH
ncbi:hypothetical protein PFTANZ_05794, partial [Plasmodium falciparum Tanzania (2000708)]